MVQCVLTKPENLTDSDFERISNVVYNHCGITLNNGKKELVRARLAKLLRESSFDTFTEYLDYVMNNPQSDDFSHMIDVISTNLTSFFRENKHFEFLVSTLLPEIVSKKSAAKKKIRCWSAGCSSGEEPYSLSITLKESIPNISSWDVKILASDISNRILKVAKQGVYSPDKVSTIAPEIKHKYLRQVNVEGEKHYQVTPDLRNLVVFKYLNLMEPWPMKGPLDFIFCRNVMIYFDKQTQEKLVNRYWKLLDKGGVLFTGHSESLTGIDHNFKYVEPTIYKKV